MQRSRPPGAGISLWRLRWRLLRSQFLQGLRTSRLRMVLVAALTVIFWGMMYFLFIDGFHLIRQMISHAGARVQIAHAIFNVFFLALVVMLSVSAGIILFGTLYRNREVAFLLTLPIPPRRVVLYKFQEAIFFAGWGFLVLGSPLLLAYGRVVQAPWYYYGLLFPFMTAFVCIPCGLGAIGCLLAVRYLPLPNRRWLAGLGALFLVFLVVGAVVLVRGFAPTPTLSLEWFQSVLSRLQYSEQRLLPSWWLSSGLLEAAHPARMAGQVSWAESLGFFAVLVANSLLLYCLVGRAGERWFVPGFSRLVGRGRQRSYRPLVVDRMLASWCWFLPRTLRQLLLKDFRIFRRDTVQWSQLAIFVGLLIFYFLNIRRLHHGQSYSLWMVSISFLNVGVVALLLATFTTRFIYPLVSLEGRKFWTLGTLPIERGQILWGKFIFAVMLTLVPCGGLILLSDYMLQLFEHAVWLVWLHQLTCATITAGLCALAVGLGARLPNLRETSPAKIAAGFGGTLTLVLSIILILSMVMATAVPSWFWLRAHAMGAPSFAVGQLLHPQLGTEGAILLGVLMTVALAALTTCVPIRQGIAALRRLESR